MSRERLEQLGLIKPDMLVMSTYARLAERIDDAALLAATAWMAAHARAVIRKRRAANPPPTDDCSIERKP